ncbi:hypothetical protein ACROYT_G003025 [Oculina patagonica]
MNFNRVYEEVSKDKPIILVSPLCAMKLTESFIFFHMLLLLTLNQGTVPAILDCSVELLDFGAQGQFTVENILIQVER